MKLRSCFYAMVALALFPISSHAAENWGQLKLGMSVEQTIAALGQPLLRTAGRGFETWTYDKGGDVLIYGSLIGWTAPASTQVTATVAARSKDIWSENRNVPYLTFFSLLPSRNPPSPRRSNADASSQSTSDYGFYYRR